MLESGKGLNNKFMEVLRTTLSKHRLLYVGHLPTSIVGCMSVHIQHKTGNGGTKAQTVDAFSEILPIHTAHENIRFVFKWQ